MQALEAKLPLGFGIDQVEEMEPSTLLAQGEGEQKQFMGAWQVGQSVISVKTHSLTHSLSHSLTQCGGWRRGW
jgi:hypothetical protein